MALKRKRSVDSSLSSSTSSLAASTPEAQSPPLFPATETDNTSSFNFNTSWPVRKSGWESSAELGCRTRKRYRDNRPDERLVHVMFVDIVPDSSGFGISISMGDK
jgi:hypothetical protein